MVTTILLSVSKNLEVPHISGILQYVFFCVWLISVSPMFANTPWFLPKNDGKDKGHVCCVCVAVLAGLSRLFQSFSPSPAEGDIRRLILQMMGHDFAMLTFLRSHGLWVWWCHVLNPSFFLTPKPILCLLLWPHPYSQILGFWRLSLLLGLCWAVWFVLLTRCGPQPVCLHHSGLKAFSLSSDEGWPSGTLGSSFADGAVQ